VVFYFDCVFVGLLEVFFDCCDGVVGGDVVGVGDFMYCG